MTRLPQIILALVAMAASAMLGSSVLARAVVVHMWPSERFGRCSDDPRVFCEPGSERYAERIASLLPAAIEQVEDRQGGPFLKPVKIYLYSTVRNYALYSGTQGGAGSMSFGEIHLAPKMQAVPEQHLALVKHELSHLHLVQRIGALRMWQLPHWFTEGWATLISDGGGAGGVTETQATFALVHGRHFTPPDNESLLSKLSSGRAGAFKISEQMYYCQASLLVAYLQRRNPNAFTQLIRDIESGQPFGPALQKAYGAPLTSMWKDFLVDASHRPNA